MNHLSKALPVSSSNTLLLGLILSSIMLLGSCTTSKKESPLAGTEKIFYEIYVPHWGDDEALRNIIKRSGHLSSMFADVVILSPLQPVSERMRIGQIGSPYAISDYRGFNSELGSEEDLATLIDTLHGLNMMVIMDWYPAVTAYDNPLAEYGDSTQVDSVLDNSENFSFKDVTLIDYQNENAAKEMIGSMQFWLDKYHLDGFRIHQANALPEAFVSEMSDLNTILIGGMESDKAARHFDLIQEDEFYNRMVEASESESPGPITKLLESTDHNADRISYTSNYVKHSQKGSPQTVFGNRYRLAFVLATFLDGHLLLHGGQEVPLRRGTSLYQDRDFVWPEKTEMDFYRGLILLKRKNKALQALDGIETKFLNTGNEKVLGIEKTYKGHKVIGIFNFSGKSEKVRFEEPIFNLNDYQQQRPIQIRSDDEIDLAPMQFLLFTNV